MTLNIRKCELCDCAWMYLCYAIEICECVMWYMITWIEGVQETCQCKLQSIICLCESSDGVQGIKLISCKHLVNASCTFIIVRFINHIGMEGNFKNPADLEGSVHAHPLNEPPMAGGTEVMAR